MHPRNTIAIVCALLAAAAAHAGTILDANYVPTTPGVGGGLVVRNNLSDAQTFTIENTGTLSGLALDLFTYGGVPSQALSVDIVTTSGGLPSEATSGPSVLASATVEPSAVTSSPSFVDVSVADFEVTEGEQLAIVLTSSDFDGYFWKGDLDWAEFGENAGTYAGGLAYDEGADATVPNGNSYTLGSATWTSLFLYNSLGITSGPDADFGFEVFESTAAPEPSTWLSAAGALLAIAGLKFRKRVRLIGRAEAM